MLVESAKPDKHGSNVRVRGLVTGKRVRADAHLRHQSQGLKTQGWKSRTLLGFFWRWWVCDKVDPLLNVTLQTPDALLKKLLLVGIGTVKNVDGFLSSGWLGPRGQHECQNVEV